MHTSHGIFCVFDVGRHPILITPGKRSADRDTTNDSLPQPCNGLNIPAFYAHTHGTVPLTVKAISNFVSAGDDRNRFEKAADGNPYSSYHDQHPSDCWVGLELDMCWPVVKGIRISQPCQRSLTLTGAICGKMHLLKDSL